MGGYPTFKHRTQKLLTEVGTGITVYKGAKGYGSKGFQENMDIIQIILNRIDSKKAYRVVESVDKDASNFSCGDGK
jgi:PII-like signaling protein